MKYVFESDYAPLTNTICFIDSKIDEVLIGVDEWFNRGNSIVDDKVTYSKKEVSGTMKDLMSCILPFVKNASSRKLIFETNSNFCAYIDNNWSGSNTNCISSAAQILKSVYIEVSAWEHNFGKQPNANGWGGGDFIYSNPATGQYRSVGLRYELTKWEFDQYGEPLPFEELEVYKTKPVKNRLTPEMIDRYAKQFGIDFFNEDFYMPPGSKAYLIETSSKYLDTVETLTLEENRKRLGLE